MRIANNMNYSDEIGIYWLCAHLLEKLILLYIINFIGAKCQNQKMRKTFFKYLCSHELTQVTII